MNRSRVTGDLTASGLLYADIANDRVGIGSTIPGNKLSLPDSAKIGLGNAEDLALYHDGTNSLLTNSTGTLLIRADNLDLRPNTNSGEVYIRCTQNAGVELRYDTVKKFETTNTGAVVTGILTATTFSGTLNGAVTTTDACQVGDLTILNGNPDLKLKDSNHGGNNTEHIITFQDSSGNNQMNIGSPFGEQHLRIKHGTNELVKIQTDGKVGIGTVTPASLLHTRSGSSNGLMMETPLGSHYIWGIQAAGNLNNGSLAGELGIRGQSGVSISANNGTATQLRIDSSGRILKGLTTARGNFGNNTSGVEYGTQIEGTSAITSGLSIVRNSDDANDGGIVLGKTRAGSTGGNTVVQAGDDLGNLTFAGSDGTSLLFGAEIFAEVQTGVGNDDLPTDLIFKTNSGSTSTTERLRIRASGQVEFKNGSFSDNVNCVMASGSNLEIGATSTIKLRTATNERLRVDSAGSVHVGFSGESLYFQNGFNNSNARIQNAGATNNSNLRFLTRDAGTEGERVRITSTGRVGVNESAPDHMFHIKGTSADNNPVLAVESDSWVSGRSAALRLAYTDGNAREIRGHYEHGLQFILNNGEAMRITTVGQVLIGTTTNPAYTNRRFTVATTSGTTAIEVRSATDGDGRIYFTDNTTSGNVGAYAGKVLYDHTDNFMAFHTGGDDATPGERLRITSGGNVKIGGHASGSSTGGEDKLNIKGSGAQFIYLGSNDASGAGVYFDGDSNGDMAGSDYARIMHNTDGYMQYDNWKSGGGHRFAIGGNTRIQLNEDGALSFTGAVAGTLGYTFYNATGNSSSDTQVLIKTYANQGADPYIKFDSGGSNMVVGQLWAGTTNNKLVLGVGESPSGGVSGVHITGGGNTEVTNYIYMSKASDPRIYSGTNVGLNIDGMALYLNRYVNSSISMGNGGGGVSVSNTTSGNDAQFNIYKSSGSDSDKAILRVGYNGDYCYSIHRQRNSGDIILNQTQGGGKAHHQNTGDDTMILTNRNSVHIAKLAPMVISAPHVQSNASWGASRPIRFVMRFSTGNYSANYHVARMISQNDWGFADWEATVYHDYYSPSSNTGSTHRYTGYYASHTDQVKDYNQNSSGSGTGNSHYLNRNTNLGPGGTHKIHESDNGGYYRDCYATDYYLGLGNYQGCVIEIKVNNPGGWLKDQATTLSTIYPAAFNGQASQSDANSWSYGRGLWFNVRPGILDNSWWNYSSNFGQQTLPTS